MLYKTQGIIIKKSNLGEFDQLLTVYTKEFGKVLLKGKSVRKNQAKLKGHLELFLNSYLMIAPTKGFDIITGAETLNNFSYLHKNLSSLASSYYLSELLYHETKGAEHAKRALEKFETILKEHPSYDDTDSIYAFVSGLYRRYGELDKSTHYYNRAIESASNDEERVDLLLGLGAVYVDKGNSENSEEAYKQALALAKGKRDLSKINFELGILYFELDRTDDAIEVFGNALKFLEFDPVMKSNKEYAIEIFWHLGSLYYDKGEYDRAIGYMEKALESIEEDHVYYCNTQITLGHCYFGKEDYNRAQSYYDGVLLFPLATNEEIEMANESRDECLKQIEKNMGLK